VEKEAPDGEEWMLVGYGEGGRLVAMRQKGQKGLGGCCCDGCMVGLVRGLGEEAPGGGKGTECRDVDIGILVWGEKDGKELW
jgi:hypothetical protein